MTRRTPASTASKTKAKRLRPKILSGGEAGAQRGALDAAIELRLKHGGWCRRARAAEDGTVPDLYVLAEAQSRDDLACERWNVRDSDATLALTGGTPDGCMDYTRKTAIRLAKPFLHLNIDGFERDELIERIRAFVVGRTVLNVSGSPQSSVPEIQERVRLLLVSALSSKR